MLKSKYFELRNHQQYENRRKNMTYIKYPYKKAKRSSIISRLGKMSSAVETESVLLKRLQRSRSSTLKMIPTIKIGPHCVLVWASVSFCFFEPYWLKGHCHEDFAVLGQFRAIIITLRLLS